MSDVVIRAENLGKKYTIQHQRERERYVSLRDVIANRAKSLFRNPQSAIRNPQSEDFWALKDVSFEIKQGEVVGIIGRNGAGKSTLLKILSRITEPTNGRIGIKGRVASLLEVGTGFHPELTGRENIYLNGAILGMGREEIKRKFDEIVAFAEVEKFLDTPVKRYSSGMYVRLAFSVAAHLEPELLIIDEVLAVGDAEFQKKCLGRMGEIGSEGRTVLFVSHNMAAVQSLCRRAVWLNSGNIVTDGPSCEVVSAYLSTSLVSSSERIWNDLTNAPGNDRVRIRRACVRPEASSFADEITIKTPFSMEFEYWNFEPDARLNLSLHISNEQNVIVFNAVPIQDSEWYGRPFPVGLFRSVCQVPGGLMNNGLYRVELLVVKNQATVIYHHDDILVFDIHDVVEKQNAWHGGWVGAVRPALGWRTELVNPEIPVVS